MLKNLNKHSRIQKKFRLFSIIHEYEFQLNIFFNLQKNITSYDVSVKFFIT